MGTREKRRSGIGTEYLMAMIYVMEFCIQGGVADDKAASSKTADFDVNTHYVNTHRYMGGRWGGSKREKAFLVTSSSL